MTRRARLALVPVLMACGGPPAPPSAPHAAEPPPTTRPAQRPDPVPPPGIRLPGDVVPERYALELTIVPSADNYRGVVDIDVRFAAATDVVWLHALDLAIASATVTAGGETLVARPVIAGDRMGLALDRRVGPGPGRLSVAFSGAMSERATDGILRRREGDDWYAFSDFEPLDARQAFPCFDEPSFKVPWRITLRVPQADTALASTPALRETATEDGLKTVVFAETKPLPSYLVAIAVGPFDLVEVPGRVPTRVVTPRGRGAEARKAAEVAPALLALLEETLGSPYPYEKLDLVAVPGFGHSGMENPGLITFRLETLIAPDGDWTLARTRGLASLAAHELAHLWFGDLVTMAWWDDLWLNEALATWGESEVVAKWKPEWDGDFEDVSDRAWAMAADSLVSARRIRQPIVSDGDILGAFDAITYTKGAAVMRMFESWLGPQVFQRGVRRYLASHAHGNGTAADFVAAVEAEAGPDSAALWSFLDQGGVPLVTMSLACDADQPATLAVAQERYAPAGAAALAPQSWRLPLCVRYGDGKEERRECTVLSSPRADWVLPGGGKCPTWLEPNADGRGYYRVLAAGDRLPALVGKRATPVERVAALSDLAALAAGGRAPVASALAHAARMAGERDPRLVAAAIEAVEALAGLVPDALRPAWAALVRRTFGVRAAKLGTASKKGEDEATRLLRPQILALVAGAGGDPKLAAEARRLADRWLVDRGAVEPELRDAILQVAARGGDRTFFERLKAQVARTTDRAERRGLLVAMAASSDPAAAQGALEVLLADGLAFRERRDLFWALVGNRDVQPALYAFVHQRFDEIVRVVPVEWVASLAHAAEGFCDDARRLEVEADFRPRAGRFLGGERALDQVTESIHLCAAARAAQQESLAAFLAR